MDNYHVPHGKGSSFSSWARLSIPWVWSSSPDGDIGGDAFFCYTFRVGRGTSISFFPNSRKFLRWIFCFAFRWLYTLISSRVRRFSMNSVRESGFSSSFTDSFRLKLLICEHLSSFGLKPNLSFCPLMLSWITPTHQCAWLSCSRMASQIWEGSQCRFPCPEWQNQWGQRNSVFSPEYPWRSPWDDELIGLLAANTWQ